MSSMKTPFNVDISVIVPARNEEPYIGRCLDSLVAQDYGGAYEVIEGHEDICCLCRTRACALEPGTHHAHCFQQLHTVSGEIILFV